MKVAMVLQYQSGLGIGYNSKTIITSFVLVLTLDKTDFLACTKACVICPKAMPYLKLIAYQQVPS